MFSLLLQVFLLFCALNPVLATVYVTRPLQSTTCHGGQPCEVDWVDDGQAPLLSDIGLCYVGLYNGNNVLVQQISPVDVAASHSLTFTPDSSAGPNSNTYYINFTSTSRPYTQFSTFFTLAGMSGTFSAPVPSDTSSLPLPSSITTLANPSVSVTITINSTLTATSIPSSASRSSNSSSVGTSAIPSGSASASASTASGSSASIPSVSGIPGSSSPSPSLPASISNTNSISQTRTSSFITIITPSSSAFPSVTTLSLPPSFTFSASSATSPRLSSSLSSSSFPSASGKSTSGATRVVPGTNTFAIALVAAGIVVLGVF